MNKIEKFVESLTGKKRIIFFLVIIVICIIAVAMGIYVQYFYKYSETDPLMLGIHIGTNKTDEEYSILKSNFINLFINKVYTNSSDIIDIEKIKTSQEIVYTGYTIKNEDEAYYDVDLILPVLNIDNENAKEINSEIEEGFSNTASQIMRSTSQYTVYNVSYVAYINENIVSIVIKETAKYGSASETTTITTYNYDMLTNSKVSLQELIELKETDEQTVQDAIDEEIQTAYENSVAIADEYGTEVIRDPESDMYKIENSNTYFLTDDGYVYIIYDYGETEETNEMDIVIF